MLIRSRAYAECQTFKAQCAKGDEEEGNGRRTGSCTSEETKLEPGCRLEDARVEGGRERTGGVTIAPGLSPGLNMRPLREICDEICCLGSTAYHGDNKEE